MAKRMLVINREIKGEYVEQINRIIPDWEIVLGNDSEEFAEQLKEADVILHGGREIDPHIASNGRLKWLQTWYAGINGLPLEALQKHDVKVTNAKGVHTYSASETVFALLLGFTRKIHTYVRQQQQKIWDDDGITDEIHEKTMGIIGAGVIGKEVAKIAKAFGMKVLGVRQSGKAEENMDHMYTPDQLKEVLPQCDVVVIILPLTNGTKNLFAAREFAQMKKGAFFINIGRGPIVNEADLIAALEQGQIAGAGLDVFATEPLPKDSPLWDMENVIITPHTAGVTGNYERRLMEDVFLPNLRKFVAGDQPTLNLIDYGKGY